MPNLALYIDDAVRLTAYSYRNGQNQDPYDNLSSYGVGKSFIRSDRRMRPNGFANNWNPLRSQGYSFLGGISQVSFSASHAQRGEVLPTIAATSIGIASYPTLSYILNPAVKFLLPSVFGATGVAAMSSLVAVLPAYGLGVAAARSVRYFKDFGYKLRHIEMGGDYQDTATASNLRLRTVSEMSSAMSYSRKWLGQEARIMREQ
jgi:hypothetical protein